MVPVPRKPDLSMAPVVVSEGKRERSRKYTRGSKNNQHIQAEEILTLSIAVPAAFRKTPVPAPLTRRSDFPQASSVAQL